MIKAYFFDWMGTLANVSESQNIRELLTDDQHNLLLTGSFEHASIPARDCEHIRGLLSGAKQWLYKDSFDIIKKLKASYKLAIISNMYDITSQKVRKSFHSFLSNFDVITLSPEVGIRKPSLKIFTYTLNKLNQIGSLNLLPSEVMMIGDDIKNDILPAKELGMGTRLIDRAKQNLGDLILI